MGNTIMELMDTPGLLLLWLVVSLAVTLAIYCAGPLIFVKCRKTPITAKKYRVFCYLVNFAVAILTKIISDSTASSFAPYLLWTSVFTEVGIKRLRMKCLLSDVVTSKSPKTGNSTTLQSTENSEIDIQTKETADEAPKVKFCRKCGQELIVGSSFCPHCGCDIGFLPVNQITTEGHCIQEEAQQTTMLPNTAYSPKREKASARKPKKPINKKLVVCLTVIPALLALVSLFVVFVGIPGLHYIHANNLLENGNYELAYTEFENLGGYADSETMLLECRYVQAVKYRDSGDYELANKMFESLGNYRDSKILIHTHDYIVSNTIAATCIVAGSETYKCVNCEETYMKALDKTGHSYMLVSSKDATCNANGSKTYKCAGCDHTYSETVGKLTHRYMVVASQEPTCQTEGFATHKCSLCSDEYTETKGKVSHKTTLASTTDATCTATGTKIFQCKDCTHTYSEVIAIKPHNYSSATCTTPKTCGMCKKTDGTALGHTNTVVCTRCGYNSFETITLSGTGDYVYKNLNLPAGKYRITIDFQYADRLSIEIFNGSTTKKILDKWNSTVGIYEVKIYEVISTINNGHIYISSNSSGTRNWTIIIEAIGN